MRMRNISIEKRKDKIRIEYTADNVAQEELDGLVTIMYTGELPKTPDSCDLTEEDVLAIVNGWLDGERYSCDLTQEEQDACDMVLSINKKRQEQMGMDE